MDQPTLASIESLLRQESAALAREEPVLAPKLERLFGPAARLDQALSRLLSALLACGDVDSGSLQSLFEGLHERAPELRLLAALDIQATLRRDPASQSPLRVVLHHKGFHALQAHRAAHLLWSRGRRDLALHVQCRASTVLAVDVHPACRIGHSTMFDHGTGIVIGETCEIQDGVSILQGVTLGGTGKQRGDRHPKIGDGVLIGAGAILLGAIRVGVGARIGAGSVVLSDVAPHTTAVGVPARMVGPASAFYPAEEMDHTLDSAAEPLQRMATHD
jgi:serine O-acetyltransferase